MGFLDHPSPAMLVSANASDKKNLSARVRRRCRKAVREQLYQTSQSGPSQQISRVTLRSEIGIQSTVYLARVTLPMAPFCSGGKISLRAECWDSCYVKIIVRLQFAGCGATGVTLPSC